MVKKELSAKQDHRRWRYHRRLLCHQSPFIQLKRGGPVKKSPCSSKMWSGNFIFAGYCVLNSRSEAVEETSYFGSIYLQKMNRTQRSVGSVDSEHIGQQYCSWSRSSLAKDILRTNITIDTCSFLVCARQFNLVHQRQVCFWSTFPETNEGLYLFEERERRRLANCPAVFLSYFSLWICYEIQLTNTKIQMSQTSRLSRAIN